MDLLRSWTAGAAVWLAWAVASALLHLWLLPLGTLDVPSLRLAWVGLTTLTGYLLVALAAGLAHPRARRADRNRRAAAVWALPAFGVPLEGAARIPHLTHPSNGASAVDWITLGTAVAMIAAGAAAGGALARSLRAHTARSRRPRNS
ncbi:hypothetical protein GCM10023224_13650 [Streptomonospora halophila]|uniref:Uncharacterized protein n=1 Tax=Streptomonospora halophila TaxID=427369 RepID=A0ABP9G9Q2_9ACTN